MVTFISPHSRYGIYMGKKKLSFVEGRFSTENEEEINYLRNHKDYGKLLVEGDKVGKKSNIITGLRSAGVDELKSKFREYEDLKNKCIKLDGTPRKDAVEAELNRFNELKLELEL